MKDAGPYKISHAKETREGERIRLVCALSRRKLPGKPFSRHVRFALNSFCLVLWLGILNVYAMCFRSLFQGF